MLNECEGWPAAVQAIIDGFLARGNSSENAAQTPSSIAQVSTWKGAAGDAAREADRQHQSTLIQSADNNKLVEGTGYQVHGEAEALVKEIHRIQEDARSSVNGEEAMDVNLVTDTVVPPPSYTGSLSETATAQKVASLQARLDKAKTDSHLIDDDIARLIKMATGQAVPDRAERPNDWTPDTSKPKSDPKAPDADKENQFDPKRELGNTDKKGGIKDPLSADGRNKIKNGVWGNGPDPHLNDKDNGQVIQKNGTGEHEGSLKNLAKGDGYRVDLGYARWKAEEELRQRAAQGNVEAEFDLLEAKAKMQNESGSQQMGADAGVGIQVNADATAGQNGAQAGVGVMAGAHAGIKYEGDVGPLHISSNTQGYYGYGSMHSFNIWEENGKIMIGGAYGSARGAGFLESFKLEVDPKKILDGTWLDP